MTEDSAEALRARLAAETGRIAWPELAPHFARGVVVKVANGLDLLEVAAAFADDDRRRVSAWMDAGELARADDADAAGWSARAPALRAVVVAPWVLAQEVAE